MKDKTAYKEFVWQCALIAIAIYALFNVVDWILGITSKSDTSTNNRFQRVDIVKTVAHLPMEDDNWELLYINEEADIAYYRYIGDRKIVSVGDYVFDSNENKYKVVSRSTEGFDIKYDDNVTPGMSGTKLYNKQGTEIGIISTLVNSDYVRCIYSMYM